MSLSASALISQKIKQKQDEENSDWNPKKQRLVQACWQIKVLFVPYGVEILEKKSVPSESKI